MGDWLEIAALATIVFAALGVLTAKRLQALVAWLVLSSAGVLLIVPPLANTIVTAAGLYYLVQSAIVGAAFFMLAGLISSARGVAEDTLVGAGRLSNNTLKLAYLVLAATAAGLPPFSGFFGKLMLLYAVNDTAMAAGIWAVVLIAGLITTVALAKAGSSLFWEISSDSNTESPQEVTAKDTRQYIATFSLILLALALVIFAKPVSDFAQRTAEQLHDPQQYIQAVIPDHGAINRVTRP